MSLLIQRQVGLSSMIVTDEESLRATSQKLAFVEDSVLEVVRQMKEAALDWESGSAHKDEVAIAMAAMQIGQPYKIIIVRSNPRDKSSDFDVYVNPKIIKHGKQIALSLEGCLSVPGVYAQVPRYVELRVKANNLSGELIKFKSEGLLSFILQHEIDHFHGKLFTDYVERKDWLRMEDILQLAEQSA